MGYHPGAEDDAIYLSAVKSHVNPALYPHDSAFFLLQMRTSIFDKSMGYLIRTTSLPVAWAELLIQAAAIFLMLLAGWKILCLLFEGTAARWGGLAMLGAMLTLPVAGTALFITDQYPHPRNMATAVLLFAVERILSGKRWQAVPLVLLAFVLHPLMGSMGISFCFVLTLTLSEPVRQQVLSLRKRLIPATAMAEASTPTPVAAAIPFAWIFDKPTSAYARAASKAPYFFLFQWTWYEWLGALGPLVIFWAVARIARKRGNCLLARFATAVLIYGVFQQAVAIVLLRPGSPLTFYTLEPMRFLQIIYVFMMMIFGACIGHFLLKGSVWRWVVFLAAANGSMCYAQMQLFPASEHIELPGAQSRNQWLQAFTWVRENTPQNAYFALDPSYEAAPGEDFHSFRALAERSVLADAIKDSSMVTKVPEVAQEWEHETVAQQGWTHFGPADFARLKRQFGVDWVLVANHQAAGLACPWHNETLSACRIP